MSGYIQEQFIAILKKTDPPHVDVNGWLDARTTADYETLRNYATEGGEAHDGIGDELSVFITYGVTAWIRPFRQTCHQGAVKPKRLVQDEGRQLLTILLANMIESRGGI